MIERPVRQEGKQSGWRTGNATTQEPSQKMESSHQLIQNSMDGEPDVSTGANEYNRYNMSNVRFVPLGSDTPYIRKDNSRLSVPSL